MLRTIVILFGFIAPVFFFVACSGSEETQADPADNEGEFTQVDAEEPPAIPEESEPDGGRQAQAVPPADQQVEPAQQIPRDEPEMLPPASAVPQPNPDAQQQPEYREPVPPPAAQNAGLMMWSVQIGAFKDDAGAIRLVQEAKSKLTQPIYKDYDPVTGFFKVTVGSFNSQEQASRHKMEVRASGFPDAFTVEVRR